MANGEKAAFAIGCAIQALDYDPGRRVLTVFIDPLHDPDKSRSTRFCDDQFPDAVAMHVVAGDVSKIVYFKGVDGWGTVNTRVRVPA